MIFDVVGNKNMRTVIIKGTGKKMMKYLLFSLYFLAFLFSNDSIEPFIVITAVMNIINQRINMKLNVIMVSKKTELP